MPRFRDREASIRDRPILPGSLRFKLAAPFVGLVAAVLLVLTLVLGAQARSFYLEQLSDQLADQAFLIGDSLQGVGTQPPPNDTVVAMSSAWNAGIDARITIIGPNGWVIADSDADPATMGNHNNRPEIEQARASGLGQAERRSATLDEGYLYLAISLASPAGYVVRLAVPLEHVSAMVSQLQQYTLAAAGVAIILVIANAWFIAGRIVRPLEDLRRHAHAMADGDLSIRVAPANVRELAEVGFAFNTMSEEVQASHNALEQTRLRLEAVLTGLADGVVLTDSDGLVLRINRAAELLLGADQGAAIGRPFVQVSRDHEINQLLSRALEDDAYAAATVEHGLNQRTLMTTATAIEGTLERMGLVVLRDVSELRRLESVRREFVANVSHELRTPLTSIRAMVETLESGVVEDRATEVDFFGRIVGEVDRLNALVEDLLDLARLEAGRTRMDFARYDPVEIVRDGADRLRPQVERAGLEMSITHGDNLGRIKLDRTRIEQVLINLIHNAIKFTPSGGAIVLDVRQDNRTTTISVSDTGIGVAPEDQARLFERFYKSDRARSSGGTGLGLAIAKHIVQTHGGEISLVSEPGKGATFTLTLPNRRGSK